MDIFRDLTRDEIEELFKNERLRECPTGTVFFTPDDTCERLFILKEGQAVIYRLTPHGKRLVTRRIEPGTVFGEMGLLGQTMQGCFAEASNDSLVCEVAQEDILRVFKQRPDVALRMLEVVGSNLKLFEERLEQALFSPVRVRLANFLLSNMDPRTGQVSGYTHAEIGDTIGALRQTVTELLDQMREEGLVEVGHKKIRVADRQGLEAMALG